jgi:hypothetical protein
LGDACRICIALNSATAVIARGPAIAGKAKVW